MQKMTKTNNKIAAIDIDKVWANYAKKRDAHSKEQLIVHYSPMIKFVVGKMSIYVSNSVDFDDLVSYGIFGLIDAIDKFDYGKGIKFETYASLRIRGAVIDSLRALDWVPRQLRQKSRVLDQAYKDLEAKLQREPTDDELAEALGIDTSQLEGEIKKSSLMALISLDDYLEANHDIGEGGHSPNTPDTPEAHYEQKELKELLVAALESLTEKERMVTTLYYFEDMTLKEIAKTLDVSESRASQLHSKAMLKLRTKLGKHKSILLNS